MFALQIKLDADKLKDHEKKDDAAEKTAKAGKAKSSKSSKS